MKIVHEKIAWTQEMLDNLEKLWVQYQNWHKVSEAMGIPSSRCRRAFYRYVKTQKGIVLSKKYWTEERIREFCDLWANEPDLQKILERFPRKDIWTLRQKARELKVKRLAGVGKE